MLNLVFLVKQKNEFSRGENYVETVIPCGEKCESGYWFCAKNMISAVKHGLFIQYHDILKWVYFWIDQFVEI